SHYTPKPFPEFLAVQSIDSMIIEKCNEYFNNKVVINDVGDLFSKNIKDEQLNYIFYNIILNVKSIDLACGSSSLLLGVVNHLFHLGRRLRDRLKIHITDYDLKKVLLNSIRGVDKNSTS
ncbi:unnamed protein product, partial [marine sediment metagenome]